MIIIAGPCVVENEEITMQVAEKLYEISKKFKEIDFYFKSSYKKANRTKISSFTTLGMEEALGILKKVKERYGLKVLTDVHETWECKIAAEYVDVLQIPAFLCRQTELLIAAGETNKTVNIKKGQFLSPEAMKWAIEKVETTGNRNIFLTERGTTFGYNNLVVDMTGIVIMKKFGKPVIIDATHSIQIPNQTEGVTGGNREMIETVALSAIAAGADGVFMETHPNPAKALSDAASQLELSKLEEIIYKSFELKKFIDKLKQNSF